MKNLSEIAGFTLVEILIVIVILGILAGIIVPRMLAQTESAHIAEALNMIGAIRHGEVNHLGLNGSYYETGKPGVDADWQRLGLNIPNTGHFIYYVDAWNDAGGPGFMVVAVRNALDDPSAMYMDKLIAIDHDGMCLTSYANVENCTHAEIAPAVTGGPGTHV